MTKSKKIISILLAAIIAVSIVVVPASVSAKSQPKIHIKILSYYYETINKYSNVEIYTNVVTNAKSYTLKYPGKTIKNLSWNQLQKADIDLGVPNKNGEKITVIAYNKNKKKICSGSVTLPAKPKGVTGVKATTKKKSIEVKWSKKNNARKYTVEYTQYDPKKLSPFGLAGYGKTNKEQTNKTKITLTKGIKSNKHYRIRVNVLVETSKYNMYIVSKKAVYVKTKK